jgi:alpha-tubulin suppressor-like RCC1 family protein
VYAKRKDEILAWGQCGFDEPEYKSPVRKDYPEFVDIFCGGNHNLGLDSKGQVWSWGRNHASQLGRGDSGKQTVGTFDYTPQKVVGLENGNFTS